MLPKGINSSALLRMWKAECTSNELTDWRTTKTTIKRMLLANDPFDIIFPVSG